MEERIKAIVRIVALFVVAINALLTAKGISPLPFDEEAINEVVSYTVAGVLAIYAWWKNNNITAEAISAQNYLNGFKKQKVEEVQIDEADETD